MTDPLRDLLLLWRGLNKVSLLSPHEASSVLARVGDPDAFASLFPDAATWSPSNFGPEYQSQEGGRKTLADVIGTPSFNPLENKKVGEKKPALTPEQMKELFSLMPRGDASWAPPAPAAGRPTGYGGNMMQLGFQQRQMRIPTLAELIYGRR